MLVTSLSSFLNWIFLVRFVFVFKIVRLQMISLGTTYKKMVSLEIKLLRLVLIPKFIWDTLGLESVIGSI